MKPLKDMAKDIAHKLNRPSVEDTGPLGEAVNQALKAIAGARKKGTFNSYAIFPSLAVLIEHISVQRDALYCAVDLVNAMEQGSAEELARLIVSFKAKAVKARLHQYVPQGEEGHA